MTRVSLAEIQNIIDTAVSIKKVLSTLGLTSDSRRDQCSAREQRERNHGTDSSPQTVR
jgi:hypothetical protein